MADVVHRVRVKYEGDTSEARSEVQKLAAEHAAMLQRQRDAQSRLNVEMQERAQQHAAAQTRLNVFLKEKAEDELRAKQSVLQRHQDAQAKLNVWLQEQAEAHAKRSVLDEMFGPPGEGETRIGIIKSGFGEFVHTLDHVINVAARVGSVIGGLVERFVGMGSEAEDTRIAIAGMMQAGGAPGTAGPEGFTRAMQMSQSVVAKMRADARDLPGEFQDLMNVFRGGGLRAGLQAGRSVGESEQMSARLMSVGAVLQMPSDLVGREFGMLMQGRAAAHNTLWMMLKDNVGKTAEEFNKLSAPAKWAAIDQALKGYDPAMKEFGNTWSAVSSTTQDYAKEVTRLAGTPVFDAMRDILAEINGWYESHRAEVGKLAQEFGTRLANGIKGAWEWAKAFGPTLAEIGGFLAEHAGTILRLIAGYKALEVALSIARNWEQVTKAASVATELWTGAQWLLDAALMANPIGAVIIAVGVLVVGIGTLIAYIKEARLELLKMFDSDTYNAAFRVIGTATNNPALLQMAEMAEKNKGALHYEMGRLTAEINDQEARGRGGLGGHIAEVFDPGGGHRRAAGGGDHAQEIIDAINSDEDAKRLAAQGKVARRADTHITNNVTVNQTVNEAEDGDRILVMTKKVIDMALYHPVESAEAIVRR